MFRKPRPILFAMIPMTLGIAGAGFDEWSRLGFSAWRAACRDAGPTLASLFSFTLQLLPTAVAGVLLGGLLVLIGGALRRHPHGGAAALAGHAGCVAGMCVGLPLCLLALPLPLVLGAEILLTALSAWLLYKCAVGLISTARARAENSWVQDPGGEEDDSLECRG